MLEKETESDGIIIIILKTKNVLPQINFFVEMIWINFEGCLPVLSALQRKKIMLSIKVKIFVFNYLKWIINNNSIWI